MPGAWVALITLIGARFQLLGRQGVQVPGVTLFAFAGGDGEIGDLSRKTFSAGKTEFPYGAFINATISFILVAAALCFLVVLPVNKLHERFAPNHDVQAPKRECPQSSAPYPPRHADARLAPARCQPCPPRKR
ncbi:MscL family protein [Streptomyces sp. NPDC051310]|uniref:MscL family protein n=1 Tax=Streptomyces sp. NPDC051310 TaxID=3365649 RepID=UPI0037B3907E